MTRKQENENKRTEILKKIWALIESEGDEVIQIKKNEIAFPFVYDNGDESFVKSALSLRYGSRDGDIFDAYSLGEELKIKLWGGHLWNPSYFVATISENTEEQIRKYIQNQKRK